MREQRTFARSFARLVARNAITSSSNRYTGGLIGAALVFPDILALSCEIQYRSYAYLEEAGLAKVGVQKCETFLWPLASSICRSPESREHSRATCSTPTAWNYLGTDQKNKASSREILPKKMETSFVLCVSRVTVSKKVSCSYARGIPLSRISCDKYSGVHSYLTYVHLWQSMMYEL